MIHSTAHVARASLPIGEWEAMSGTISAEEVAIAYSQAAAKRDLVVI